jgi:hypothetical protein
MNVWEKPWVFEEVLIEIENATINGVCGICHGEAHLGVTCNAAGTIIDYSTRRNTNANEYW